MAFYVIAAKVAMQMIQGAQQAKAASQQSIAENKMVQKFNDKTMYSTMEQITQLNQQRAQQRQDTAAALFNVGIQGMSARDAITTQAAATDTIGASVSDAVATVNQKQGQAVGSTQDQYIRAIDQSNAMLGKITDSASNSLKNAVQDNSNAIMNQAGLSAIGSIVGSVAGQMASNTTSTATVQDMSGSAASKGSFDYQGYNSDATAGSNPFGLHYSFDTNSSLSGS